MPHLARAVIIAWTMAVLLSAVTFSGARAQFCSDNVICTGTLACHKTIFGVFGFCELVRCNSDADCTVTHRPTICWLGICQASCLNNASCGAGNVCNRNTGRNVGVCTAVSHPAAPIGTGNTASGAGGACGPQEVAPGITKIKRCDAGLVCTNGHCVRLAQ